MITEFNEIFDQVLVGPIKNGANKIRIISGYASANMVARHADYIKNTLNKKFATELIIGMGPKDGLELANHKSLIQLQNSSDLNFRCNYIINSPPVHSKIYLWTKDDEPFSCFSGSANFTQNAFSPSMRETVCSIDPKLGLDYFDTLRNESMNCADDRIINYIDFYEQKRVLLDFKKEPEREIKTRTCFEEKVTLTLLHSDKNEVPARSGLNWGQRPGREKNQAYINIPANIGRSGFFPDIRNTFTLLTDDDKYLICVRAQANGKGLHTTLNNSLMGEYFRYRLGLKNGQFVTIEHLIRYGRTDVDIHKLDEETYYLDFSV
ncbi:NgoFVII family restriction endonuclease [Sphingobacterium shayense]|uniref:restriction endonuclease PLD domain-containing protein n=1 Tax=Sphingobacterium shayense TaxID=626343 RepID=UPI0015563324|nr:restriction endonuclease PLD domain-containing protein [Sphingobacterium shayense]NQD69989.1 NgoFVII family restriction endonuclease [Sphingobacterium shayense]